MSGYGLNCGTAAVLAAAEDDALLRPCSSACSCFSSISMNACESGESALAMVGTSGGWVIYEGVVAIAVSRLGGALILIDSNALRKRAKSHTATLIDCGPGVEGRFEGSVRISDPRTIAKDTQTGTAPVFGSGEDVLEPEQVGNATRGRL